MYMSTRANLDYWSTDNCCLRWSLRTGATTIGLLSLVWQSLMVTLGVMMVVRCPEALPPNSATTNLTSTNLTLTNLTSTSTNLTFTFSNLTFSYTNFTSTFTNLTFTSTNATSTSTNLTSTSTNLTSISTNRTSSSTNTISTSANLTLVFLNGTSEDPVSVIIINETDSDPRLLAWVSANNCDDIGDEISNSSLSSNSSTDDSSYNSSLSNYSCPWLPDPGVQVLGVRGKDKVVLVAGIFITYSGIYCILSFLVVAGAIKKSASLVRGWVAFTGFHNLVVLSSLLVPLPYTTLPHLLFSICHFTLTLYTWAVVKSFMYSLKVVPRRRYVDGVEVAEVPMTV